MQAIPEGVRTPFIDAESDEDRRVERCVFRPTGTHDVEIDENDAGQTLLTVPVSSTSEMRSGHVITEPAQESMVDQLEEGTVGMWDDHGLDEFGWPEYRREDLYGAWVGGEFDDDVLWATVRLREGDPRSEDLVDQVKQGMPVGFSIGYIALEDEWVDREDGERREIVRLDLLEISPVGIPDNQDAYATAGRMVAHSLADAGVTVDRQVARAVADSVEDALTTMTDTHEGDGPDEDEDEDGEQHSEPSDTHQDAEETAAAIVGIFNAHNEAANEDAEEWLEENAAGDKDDDEDEEGAEGDDEDDEGSANISDIDVDAATGGSDGISSEQFEQLMTSVEEVRAANEKLREENEELQATVDRLESEQRESAGRKGFSTGPAAGDDGGDGDASDEQTADREPADAYQAFAEE